MSISGKSLYVLTPMYGGMAMLNFVNSFVSLKETLNKFSVPHTHAFMSNESLVSRARNRLVDEFLKNSECTHAVFIDADIGFDPVDVMTMLEIDRDIVGVPCPKKEINWERVQRACRQDSNRIYKPDEMAKVGGSFVFNFEAFNGTKHFQLNELQEMAVMGTGLLMIKREVFLKFQEEYPDRWYEPKNDPSNLPGPIHDFFRVGINSESREYESEDYCFCQDARKIGCKVWMCPWVTTTHMGSYTFIGSMPAATALAGRL